MCRNAPHAWIPLVGQSAALQGVVLTAAQQRRIAEVLARLASDGQFLPVRGQS